MRNYLGTHSSGVDDEVHANIWVRGSFGVRYSARVDAVVLELNGHGGWADVHMQLSIEQVELLQELLAAGLADAIAAKVIVADAEPVQHAALPAGHDRAEGVA